MEFSENSQFKVHRVLATLCAVLVAGTWFDADTNELSENVGLLDGVEEDNIGVLKESRADVFMTIDVNVWKRW